MAILKAHQLATQLEVVLDDGREELVHQFIAKNTDVLGFAPRGMILSKYPLGREFVTDFISVGDGGGNDPRPLVMLIEIERADLPIFTVKGDPAAFLTHAVRQVQDWKRWVTANRDYLARDLHGFWTERPDTEVDDSEDASEDSMRKQFKRGDDNRERALRRNLIVHFKVWYWVIAGRRTGMRVPERLRLAQMNDDLSNITIITYDALLDGLMGLADWPRI